MFVIFPALHNVQDSLLVVLEKDPALQFMHDVGEATFVPGEHVTHRLEPAGGFMPAGQDMHNVLFDEGIVPFGQGVQEALGP